MSDQKRDIPKCTGCHFGCRLDRYQCGRGMKLHGEWEAGEEPHEMKLTLPAQAQVARVLPWAAHLLEERIEQTPETICARFLATHEGRATVRLLKARIGSEAADAAIALIDTGLAERVGNFVCLTKKGRTQERTWRADFDRSCTEFCNRLTPEELQQLVNLLFKLTRIH